MTGRSRASAYPFPARSLQTWAIANGEISTTLWAAYRDHRLRRALDSTSPACDGVQRKLASRASARLQTLIEAVPRCPPDLVSKAIDIRDHERHIGRCGRNRAEADQIRAPESGSNVPHDILECDRLPRRDIHGALCVGLQQRREGIRDIGSVQIIADLVAVRTGPNNPRTGPKCGTIWNTAAITGMRTAKHPVDAVRRASLRISGSVLRPTWLA